MRKWRQQALGDDAPWAPTLVRATDDTVEAWTGWQIAPVLSRHLDAKTTWRVLGALGGNALDNRKRKVPRFGRSAFIRGAVGSIVGLGVLMKAGPAAADTPARSSVANVNPDDVEVLHNDRLMAAARRGLATSDFANVADTYSLVSPGGAAPASAAELPDSALRESDDATGEVSPPAGELEVYGVEIDRGEGITETSVVYYQHEQSMLVHVRVLDEPVDGIKTRAHRLHVEHGSSPEHPFLSTLAHSINGAVPTPIPEGDLDTLSADPCGGCNLSCGPGNPCEEKHLTEQCNWEATWQCVAGLGGCALCVTCGGWFTCIACALASCPAAVDACCTSTDTLCAICVYPT
ncbi:hypothetical protein HDA32_002661 [Spinactinospora alkalitolerans]|uniref:Uncharacterized protein n=1 Tax=Spinactinospora alkalitolerans TaxID=687207 RepID=A0A852TV24_9ACTN|nr:hypothetical protein [Spinactinospora alkalitolerans]NYE47541.1 hypothetical protein [Spinactinospora alkalitolerans]